MKRHGYDGTLKAVPKFIAAMSSGAALRFAVIGALVMSPAGVLASGFALMEQNVKGLGNAYAGAVAAAEDASTVWFNPAGMTRLQGTQAVGALHYIRPSTKFTDTGSTASTAGGAVTALTGGTGGEAGEPAFVPNAYYVQELSPSLRFGLGVTVPFGLTTEYDSAWKGRYHAIRSSLTTININPSVAYRVNQQLSFGGGASIMYADGELTQAADLRYLATSGASTAQDGDATAKVTGDDLGYGFNIGMLYEVTPATRVGVAYRSTVKQNLEGDATFSPNNATATTLLAAIRAAQPGNLVDTSAKLSVKLPESLSVGLVHQLNDHWALQGDVTRTRWSRFNELRVEYGSAQVDTVVPQDWKDSNRYSFGATFSPGGPWTYRTGISYDETPVPSAERRGPRIPDSDRFWIAVGASNQISKSFSFDVGYVHLIVDDAPIDNTDDRNHRLVGEYEGSVDILSAQINWTF